MDTRALRLDGDDRGVLCVHGFTGTTHDLAFLAKRLNAQGMTVVAPLLPGHHTLPTELNVTTWRDWFSAVRETFDDLAERCPRGVAVVGQSLGALLALHLAAESPGGLRAVAALATPLWLGRLPTLVANVARQVPALADLVPALPKLGGVDIRDETRKRTSQSYRVVPVRGLVQLMDFMKIVNSELARVRAPLLVMHSPKDHTAPYACSTELVRRVSSATVRHHALDQSFHAIADDVEREVVAAEVGAFFTTQF